jgi:hypothetical protein
MPSKTMSAVSRFGPPACAGIALLAGVVSLLDPRAIVMALAAIAFGVIALIWAFRTGRRRDVFVVLLCLVATYAGVAWSQPRWCCDSVPYFIYLRSAVFDCDIHFANEWEAFNVGSKPLTATGRPANLHSVGPAILWSPFFLLAHAYVLAARALGWGRFAASGYSAPYLLSTALGTATVVVVSSFFLWRACVERFGRDAGALAVLGTILTSTIPYYVFVAPAMAHGAVFAAGAAFLVLWMNAEKQPSLAGWLRLAVLLGIISLLRWQAVVLGLMFIPLVIDAWRRRLLRWWWPMAAAGVALLVFSPQLLAWQVLFGHPFAAPSQQHGMSWSSPHFIKVLISADRGLFTWSPMMFVACLGWLPLLRTWKSMAWSAWGVFFATAWINGGVAMWWGAPLWALGLAALLQAASRVLARRPLLAPAAALLFFFAWNLGLMRFQRNGVFSNAAPIEELTQRQASLARRSAEELLERIGGPRARNLAYMCFVGRYFYLNTHFDGMIDVSRPERDCLSGGWSESLQRAGWGRFRFAKGSHACVKVPLENAADLRVSVTIRAPMAGQEMNLSANRRWVGHKSVPQEWSDLSFLVPQGHLQPGENLLCLDFTKTLPDSDDAAAVRRIQLP